MNSEIEKLKQQRKEITQRIRELSENQTTVGVARIGMEHYPTFKPDRWYLAIAVQNIDYAMGGRQSFSYRSVVNAQDKKAVVGAIPGIIKDLQELYEKEKDNGGED